MKRLLIGPAGCGKTHRILNEFHEYLQNSDPLGSDAYLLLPSAEHTDRMISLLLQRGLPGFFSRRITTLSSLLTEFFSAGTEKYISSTARYLMLRSLLEAKDWEYFLPVQKTPGFLNMALSFIMELKESCIASDQFRKSMNELKKTEPALTSKYEALAGIYEDYQNALTSRGLLDRQDLLRISQKNLDSKRPHPRLKKIWLDGFFDFSNLQIEYLKELSKITEEMVMTLTYEFPSRRPQLFEGMEHTVQQLIEMGFKIEEVGRPSRRLISSVLQHVEENLFVEDALKLKEASDITLLEAVGMQGEIEMIAREILKLYRQGDYRFSDFAILLRQVGNYEPLIRSVFRRYEIPVEIHERERLKLAPMMQSVRTLLVLFREDWKREHLLNFLKSSYVRQIGADLFKDEILICEIENQAYREGILAGRQNWLKSWEKLLQPLAELEDQLRAAHHAKEFQSILLGALQAFGFFTLEDSYEEPVRRDAASAARLEALLEEITEAANFEEFAEHLLRLIDIDLYSIPERNANRVQVYGISLARQKEYRVVFVAGLLEKVFPAYVKEDPVLSDWERELLNQTLSFPLKRRLLSQKLERYLFYLALTRASGLLYLTYPKLDLEGKEALPSFYIDEVRMLFENPLPTKRQDLSHPYPDLENVVHPHELEICLMGELWHPRPRHDKNLIHYLLMQVLSHQERRGKFLGAMQEIGAQLEDARIRQQDFFSSQRTSATSLEDYAKCPFRYYARRVLHLQDPREEVNARRKGIIRHQVLENYFKWRKSRKGRISQKESQEMVLRELEKALKECPPMIIEKKYQKALYEEELKDMLFQFLERELSILEKTPLQPEYFEFAFGTGPKPDAPALEISDGERKFRLVGKIDRVDVDPQNKTALVVDYKTSAQWSVSDLEDGVSLQLPAYVMAVEKFLNLKTIGGQLKLIKSGKTLGFYRKDLTAAYPELAKKTGMSETEFRNLLAASEDYIKLFTREMASAKMPVRPRQCDEYCPYPTVCRIQKWKLPFIEKEIREEDKKRCHT